MLNLSFMFDDAIELLTETVDRVTIIPLPATVYMMQIDVLNYYQYALEHYLTQPLNAPFLQNSWLGSPYEKWAYITNEDWKMLSIAVHNLLRYTGRFIHDLWGLQRMLEMVHRETEDYLEISRQVCGRYQSRIYELRKRPIGIKVHHDTRLSLFSFRDGTNSFYGTERRFYVGNRPAADGTQLYYRAECDADGNTREQPIDFEEYKRLVTIVREDVVEISDRDRLTTLQAQGLTEVAKLRYSNRVFAEVCNEFYRSRNVAEAFVSRNESFLL